MNVLFVCMGNIGRSPLAKSILQKKYKEHGITAEVDSAGFEAFYINEEPDHKIKELGEKHDIDVKGNARIFLKADFNKFDHIFVMDTKSYRDLKELTENEDHLNKIDYLMNLIEPGKNKIVPDPINAWNVDPETVFDYLDKATDKIVESAIRN